MGTSLVWTLKDELLAESFDFSLEFLNLFYVRLYILVALLRSRLISVLVPLAKHLYLSVVFFIGAFLLFFHSGQAVTEADVMIGPTGNFEWLRSIKGGYLARLRRKVAGWCLLRSSTRRIELASKLE